MSNKEKHRLILYISITILTVCTLIAAYKLKTLGIVNFRCRFRDMTGLFCTSCGITRMTNSLIKLDIEQAFRYNPLIVCSIPFYVYMYIYVGKAYIKHGKLTEKVTRVLCIYAMIMIAFGITRNIGWFKWMAPTAIR